MTKSENTMRTSLFAPYLDKRLNGATEKSCAGMGE